MVNRDFSKDQKKMSKKQKRQKSKQIKKILKERLNIDCLRMLCDDSGDEENPYDGAAP